MLLLEAPDGSYRSRLKVELAAPARNWLTPILTMGGERLLGVSDGDGLLVLDTASGLHRGRLRLLDAQAGSHAAGVLLAAGPRSKAAAGHVTVLTHEDADWVVLDPADDRFCQTGCTWRPAEIGPHSLRSVPLSWRVAPPLLEMVGVDRGGAVHAAEFHVDQCSVQLSGVDGWRRRRADTWGRRMRERTRSWRSRERRSIG